MGYIREATDRLAERVLRYLFENYFEGNTKRVDWTDAGFDVTEEDRINRKGVPIARFIIPTIAVDPAVNPMSLMLGSRLNAIGYARARLNYAADGVAPHAEVSRASRQITATERAVLLHANASLIKATAATTVGKVFVTVQEENGASMLYITILTNAVGDSKHDSIGGSIVEYDSNSNFVISTSDGNTGATPGTIDYRAAINLVIFNA